jgi:hypothetical protein
MMFKGAIVEGSKKLGPRRTNNRPARVTTLQLHSLTILYALLTETKEFIKIWLSYSFLVLCIWIILGILCHYHSCVAVFFQGAGVMSKVEEMISQGSASASSRLAFNPGE